MNPPRIAVKPGLYALTPTGWDNQSLLSAVDQALAGGAAMLQYRAKPRPDAGLARELLARCRSAGVPLIINDDVALAAEIEADGVHLGRDDDLPEIARDQLGPEAIIGVSCYNDLERAARLARAEVDYLAFGALFDSPTKPAAVRCPLEILAPARRFGLPLVAIGGITLQTAADVKAAGADLLAVISDLFEANDIQARARAYAQLF